MKKNYTLPSILLTGIILSSGCEPRVTPILPDTSPIEAPNHTEAIINPVETTITQHQPIRASSTQYENTIEIVSEPIVENYPEPTIENYPEPIVENYSEPIVENYPSEPTIDNTQGYTPSTPSIGGKNYQLPTIQGQTITVNEQSSGLNFPQYQGKVILLEVFGKNCEYCFKEMPIIQRIKRNYGDKLQIIAIQGDDRMSQSTASRLIAKYNMNYPIIERDDARDLLSNIGETYSWRGTLPFMQIIKDGVTEATFNDGGASYSELSSAIDGI